MSPRASGGEDSREGDEEGEEEEDQDLDRSFQPGDVMKLQLEVLEGELEMRPGLSAAVANCMEYSKVKSYSGSLIKTDLIP